MTNRNIILNFYKVILAIYFLVIFSYILASLFSYLVAIAVTNPLKFGLKEVGGIVLFTLFISFFNYLFWYPFKVFYAINKKSNVDMNFYFEEFKNIMFVSSIVYFLLLLLLGIFINELDNLYITLYIISLNIVYTIIIYLKVKSNEGKIKYICKKAEE